VIFIAELHLKGRCNERALPGADDERPFMGEGWGDPLAVEQSLILSCASVDRSLKFRLENF